MTEKIKPTKNKSRFPTAKPFVPEDKSISHMQEAAEKCKGCDLYKNATQVVFGEGSNHSKIVLIGEQPGDAEDQSGHPFVGPAGKLLDRALHEAGIDRKKVYVTNAVKHFRWEQVGPRRLHKKPTSQQVRACHPWLEAELNTIKPAVIICLGATAASSLLGRVIVIKEARGKSHETPWSSQTFVTTHPSALLRAPNEQARIEMYKEFVKDLKLAAKSLVNES